MDMIVANNGFLPSHDPYVLDPDGATITGNTFAGNFYVYLGAYSYMLFRSFMPNMELWQFLIWFPPLSASLMAIPMYYIGKILYGRRAGVLAAFFVIFDISIMSRTLGGDPDNDGIVLLMPLILMAFYLYAYKKIDRDNLPLRMLGIYSVIFGLLLSLWANTWFGGYWFILWLITGFVLFKIILDTAFARAGIKKHKYLLLHLV